MGFGVRFRIALAGRALRVSMFEMTGFEMIGRVPSECCVGRVAQRGMRPRRRTAREVEGKFHEPKICFFLFGIFSDFWGFSKFQAFPANLPQKYVSISSI